MSTSSFSADDVTQFRRDGYIIVRGLATPTLCDQLMRLARQHLAARIAPLEYEAEVNYPGAPAALDAPGGRTVRRLLQAYAREPLFRQWATSPAMGGRLQQLLGPRVALSQAHHNCIMTKDPNYGSSTGWHRDIRYWSFEHPGLVSVWLALSREHDRNGCLLLLPGTHKMEFRSDQLDAAQFLRPDLEENREMLRTQIAAEMEAGDVLFFHSRLFHAAGKNETSDTKYALVFTYHAAGNRPLPGTRSASLPDVMI
ncbi:MAG: phytanoyl-CoA dioxygenase family protein [Burkholderiales bacterium]|nr:phytanoyl-CoA dioxygenase family protein [Burkholderiales bacterium]